MLKIRLREKETLMVFIKHLQSLYSIRLKSIKRYLFIIIIGQEIYRVTHSEKYIHHHI